MAAPEREVLETILKAVGAEKYIAMFEKAAAAQKKLGDEEEKRDKKKRGKGGAGEDFKELAGNLALTVFGFQQAKAAFQEFLDAESRSIRFTQVLKNLGLEAEKPHFDALADQLSDLTGVDDDLIRSMQQTLLQFRLTAEQVDQLAPRIVDLAQANGIGLEEATAAVTRGLIGQNRALRALGIQYKSTGNQAKDLNKIMAEIDRTAKNTAETFRQSIPGAVLALETQIGNLREALVRELQPAIKETLENLISFVKFLKANAKDIAPLLKFILNPFSTSPLGGGGQGRNLQPLSDEDRKKFGLPPAPGAAAGAGGENYARQTAENTKAMKEALIKQTFGAGGDAARRVLNIRNAAIALKTT